MPILDGVERPTENLNDPEQLPEAHIHVHLLMAVEERQAGIARRHIHSHGLKAPYNHDVFADP